MSSGFLLTGKNATSTIISGFFRGSADRYIIYFLSRLPHLCPYPNVLLPVLLLLLAWVVVHGCGDEGGHVRGGVWGCEGEGGRGGHRQAGVEGQGQQEDGHQVGRQPGAGVSGTQGNPVRKEKKIDRFQELQFEFIKIFQIVEELYHGKHQQQNWLEESLLVYCKTTMYKLRNKFSFKFYVLLWICNQRGAFSPPIFIPSFHSFTMHGGRQKKGPPQFLFLLLPPSLFV